jgi:general stress protein YciG
MPRGQNEAFKASQGRFATNKDEARKAGRKGGRAKTMTMHDFKRMAQELNAEQTDKVMSRGQVMLNNLQNEAAHGNVKAIKLWLEIMQFGEPKNIDITSGGERLPDIIIRQSDGRGIASTEQDIDD